MSREISIIVILCLVLAAILLIAFLIVRSRNSKIREQLSDLNIRFNKVKTVPLAFKLNKAQSMVKLDEKSSKEVEQYFHKYEEAQRNLDHIQEMINQIEDSMAERKYNDASKAILVVSENLNDSEEEINEIDTYLDRYVQKENDQRDFSNELKERFRNLKNTINDKHLELAYSYDGLNDKLAKCEELFSSSEEWMYGNEYSKAQENLDMISSLITEIEESVELLPSLEKEARGVIPILSDELKRQYELSKQRGLYLKHLKIDYALVINDEQLKKNLKKILNAESKGVKEDLIRIKDNYTALLDALKKENEAYYALPKLSSSAKNALEEFGKILHYLEVVYNSEKERYSLEDLNDLLPEEKTKLAKLEKDYDALIKEIANRDVATTTLLYKINSLNESINIEINRLKEIKERVDNTSNGEARAISQVMKLQVVLNEVEVKTIQYRLPAISSSYKDDLEKGHAYVKEIKELLQEIPLRIDILNKTLDEAIDFIYKLYNNVNNVVGMALMVENTIVFGNKYRSTYPEVDRELSRAEFSYINGEYTQALKIALSCMEKLFPNTVDDKIMENVKNVR